MSLGNDYIWYYNSNNIEECSSIVEELQKKMIDLTSENYSVSDILKNITRDLSNINDFSSIANNFNVAITSLDELKKDFDTTVALIDDIRTKNIELEKSANSNIDNAYNLSANFSFDKTNIQKITLDATEYSKLKNFFGVNNTSNSSSASTVATPLVAGATNLNNYFSNGNISLPKSSNNNLKSSSVTSAGTISLAAGILDPTTGKIETFTPNKEAVFSNNNDNKNNTPKSTNTNNISSKKEMTSDNKNTKDSTTKVVNKSTNSINNITSSTNNISSNTKSKTSPSVAAVITTSGATSSKAVKKAVSNISQKSIKKEFSSSEVIEPKIKDTSTVSRVPNFDNKDKLFEELKPNTSDRNDTIKDFINKNNINFSSNSSTSPSKPSQDNNSNTVSNNVTDSNNSTSNYYTNSGFTGNTNASASSNVNSSNLNNNNGYYKMNNQPAASSGETQTTVIPEVDSSTNVDVPDTSTDNLFNVDSNLDDYIDVDIDKSADIGKASGIGGVIPIVAGVGAATAAGIGAKIYKDRKENNEFDLDEDRLSNENKFWTDEDASVIHSEKEIYSDDADGNVNSTYQATSNDLDDNDTWSMPDEVDKNSTIDLLEGN